jgi:hypothetical protein
MNESQSRIEPKARTVMPHNGSPADPLPVYHIRVRGELDPAWTHWFEGMQIVPQADHATLLAGPVADQAALHGLLRKIRDLGLVLLLVERQPPESAAAARDCDRR